MSAQRTADALAQYPDATADARCMSAASGHAVAAAHEERPIRVFYSSGSPFLPFITPYCFARARLQHFVPVVRAG